MFEDESQRASWRRHGAIARGVAKRGLVAFLAFAMAFLKQSVPKNSLIVGNQLCFLQYGDNNRDKNQLQDNAGNRAEHRSG